MLAAMSTLAALLIGVPAAYGLARFEWPREWERAHRRLDSIDAHAAAHRHHRAAVSDAARGAAAEFAARAAIVYTAFNLPFVVWMMRGFFDEVPREIEEAAMLDGETRMGALLRIVLPLVKPDSPRRPCSA